MVRRAGFRSGVFSRLAREPAASEEDAAAMDFCAAAAIAAAA